MVSAPAAVAAVAPAALVEIETREGAPQLTLCKAAGAMHGGSASGPEPGLGLAPGKPAQMSELPVPKPLPSNVPKKRQDRKRSRQERDNELAGYATCLLEHELELPKLVVSKLRSRCEHAGQVGQVGSTCMARHAAAHVHKAAACCVRTAAPCPWRASRKWPHTGPVVARGSALPTLGPGPAGNCSSAASAGKPRKVRTRRRCPTPRPLLPGSAGTLFYAVHCLPPGPAARRRCVRKVILRSRGAHPHPGPRQHRGAPNAL